MMKNGKNVTTHARKYKEVGENLENSGKDVETKTSNFAARANSFF